jgi:hypothetical protein
MATKETVPFNYDEIYSIVQQKFADKGYDTQEGSNTMQLVSAMSYLISMLNVNTAVNVNENLLTLARKRNNILHDSRILGYEPGNKISYQYVLTLKFTPDTDENGNYINTSFSIPKYTKFTSGGLNYYYMGDLIRFPNVIEPFETTIIVKEGNLIKADENPALIYSITTVTDNNGKTEVQYYIDIPFTDVEDDGIDCFFTYYDDNAQLVQDEIWTKFDRFQIDIDTILKQQFYRLNNIEYNMPRIYLKLPNTRSDLKIGSQVKLNILLTSGTTGAMIETPKTDEITCEITNYSLRLEGSDEESNESIKYNAPLFYNSANRAVTQNDYISICNRITTIDKTQVWDGNDEYPEKPGYIWFSFIPQNKVRQFESDIYKTNYILVNPYDKVNWFLEDAEIGYTDSSYYSTIDNTITYPKESVFYKLKSYTIPTLKLLHRHPIFFDFYFDIEIIKYDITKSETKQNASVFDVINTYFYQTNSYNSTLENFESEFFVSNLMKRVDTYLTDLTGINYDIKTGVKLNTKYIIDENFSSNGITFKKINIPLALPFEPMYNTSGNLIIDNLPNIDSTYFITINNVVYDIIVDFSSLTGKEFDKNIVTLPILRIKHSNNNIYLGDNSNITLTGNQTIGLRIKDYLVTEGENIKLESSLTSASLIDEKFTLNIVDDQNISLDKSSWFITYLQNSIEKSISVNSDGEFLLPHGITNFIINIPTKDNNIFDNGLSVARLTVLADSSYINSSVSPYIYQTDENQEYASIIGYYTIYNNIRIDIDLLVDVEENDILTPVNVNGISYNALTTGINSKYVDNCFINIKYKANNMRFTKNLLPRLYSVKFN